MSGYLTFESVIESLEWGRATYTILPLPPEVAEALEAAGAKRVEGEIADHPVNLALSRAQVLDGMFLWTGRSLLEAAGLSPGETVEVRLRPAPHDAVDTPDDVATALRQEGLTAKWEALTPGRRRGMLYQIATAKKPPTRARRVASLIAGLHGV